MIGFVTDLVIEHVLKPQATVPTVLHRAYVDPTSTPIDVQARELDLLEGGTEVTGWEIGGTVTIRHTFSVALDVQTGDPATGKAIRDAIVLDLFLRALDARETIVGETDPASGQTIDAIVARVDYAPFQYDGTDTNQSAVLIFTVDTSLDR